MVQSNQRSLYFYLPYTWPHQYRSIIYTSTGYSSKSNCSSHNQRKWCISRYNIPLHDHCSSKSHPIERERTKKKITYDFINFRDYKKFISLTAKNETVTDKPSAAQVTFVSRVEQNLMEQHSHASQWNPMMVLKRYVRSKEREMKHFN